MSDIDFDELDKAVNSLMANVDTTKRSEGLDDPEDKVVTLGDKSESDASLRPAGVAPVAVTSQEPKSEETSVAKDQSPASASSPALAVKRRGQFMDVMHPSSDMKSSPRPVKREGAALAPVSATTVAAPQNSTAPDNEPVNAASVVEASAEIVPDTTLAVTEATEPAPLTSPFLPDAKPEKRPLGTASEAAAPTVDIAAELNNEATVEATDPQVEVPAAPVVLPEELGSDVLAIESNGIVGSGEVVPGEDAQPVEAGSAEVPLEVPAAVPAGGSIPQQYAEAPSSGDQTNGSIYDTSNYHQPIESAPTAKKSSPLKWIILAIVLLVLGAAGGVGYFVLTHGLSF